MVCCHGNALIWRRKFFSARRTASAIALLISKGNTGDLKNPRFQALTVSIGRFFEISGKRSHPPGQKGPSALDAAYTIAQI